MPDLILRMLYCFTVKRRKIVCDTYHLHYFLYMRHFPISRATLNRNGLFSMYYMFTCFSHFLQTLCIYVWLEAFLEKGSSPYIFCAMIDVEQEAGQFSENMAGTGNDINHVLSTFVDSEHEVPFLQLALRRYVWTTFIIHKQWERILDTYVKYTKSQCKI